MRIMNNIMALNAHRQLGANHTASAKSMEKLSSGLRINRAGDDAAGLAISEKMRGQIRGLKQAGRNAQDGISLIQTAEGALNETHAILQRMRELAVQSATDTNTATDRAEIQKEIDQLANEISRISNTTEFNTQNLMAGGLNNTFHIGANQGQSVGLRIAAMDAHSLGVAAARIDTTVTAGSGITGISGVTENLGASAAVAVENVTDATATVTQGEIKGTVAVDDATAYTGYEDKTIHFKLETVDGSGVVSAIRLSTDGGSTYTGAIISVDSGKFDLGDGLSITIATDAENEADKAGSVDITAKTADIKLTNSAGDVGNAVTVRGNQTSVIVGDQATNRTANVSFDFASLAVGTAAISQVIDVSTAATVDALGNVVTEAVVKAGINVSTQSAANSAIATINDAIETVSAERSKLGAMQNRLEHTIANLGASAENLQAAESRIRDVDMAEEMMAFTKYQILQQASTAMLAQANMAPQSVLQLLG